MSGIDCTGWRRVCVLFLIILPMLLTEAFAADNHPKNEHINFVSFTDYPYIFEQTSSEPGLVVRYVDALMKRAAISYTLKILPPKRALLYAASNASSCVFPVERSQEREVLFSWVSPISISRHGLFSLPGGASKDIKVLEDASEFVIGSYLGSGVGEHLKSLSYKIDFAADNDANIYKLNAKRIDLWASDTLSASFISDAVGMPLDENKLDFFTTLRAIACNLFIPNSTIKKMNKNLRAMYQDGSIERIRQEFERDYLLSPAT